MSLHRIAVGVEYDGSRFSGWQIQKDGRSVQEALESALARVANGPVRTICAGRTDAGVHAFGQVVHFDTAAARRPRSWVLGTNSELPEDVNLCWAREVGEAFHARFSAVSRSYRYLVLNRPVRSSLWRDRSWVIYPPLDVAAMREAARHFLGEHDFSSLRAAGCQAKSPVRTMRSLEIKQCAGWLSVDLSANAFLQHMVRNILGVLVRIGRGEAEPGWAREVLLHRDRRRAGVTAPASGLYLTRVDYPDEFQLPAATALASQFPVCGSESGS